MTLEEFLDKVRQRPLPQNAMARVRTLAKELAEGAAEGLWKSQIPPIRIETMEDSIEYDESVNSALLHTNFELHSPDIFNLTIGELQLVANDMEPIFQYIVARWKPHECPDFRLLESNKYLAFYLGLKISDIAFALLEETEPSTIFISYKRSESSPFALLVLKYLKEAGLEPFLDMALVPGEDWHDGLKERIQSRDYFILLLGKATLESTPVIKEIEWALEKGLNMIPIWQPGFEFIVEDWPGLPDPIKHKLANTHTIRVLEENPTAYHSAMVELLNRFGITP